MTGLKLILRSIAYYWRTHVGVAAGAAVATAVLVGALVVGDSVRHSLRTLALRRLGNVRLALAAGDRFFRAEAMRQDGSLPPGLARDLRADLGAVPAPVLMLDGSAKTPDGSARANRVQVLGVDGRFWPMGGAPDLLEGAGEDQAVLNTHLARQLGVRAGQEVVLRISVPSGLPREAPLSTDRDAAAALRVTVKAVAGDEQFGRFGLQANQLAPFSVFLRLDVLQSRAGPAGMANVLLVPAPPPGHILTPAGADAALGKKWRLADADLQLRQLPGGALELRTGRVFLDPPAAEAALAADANAMAILTYFVDEVRLGDKAAPYCIVTALDAGPRGPGGPATAQADRAAPAGPALAMDPLPPRLGEDEIVLNDWLAEDLGAKVGDRVMLSYRTLGPMRTFQTQQREMRIAAVVPIAGLAADPNLMPDFPGLADVANCRDWKPGVPVDLERIRKKDEEYWNRHRGTPKAFVSLAAGQRMWGNRFGNLTMVRYGVGGGAQVPGQDPPAVPAAEAPSPDTAPSDAADRATETARARRRIERAILSRLRPAELGLYFVPVRRQALAAANPTSDFGGLFLGLSFFLIVAAALLTGLLFVFNIEQRSRQVGVMLAVGFRSWPVRGLLLAEGAVLAAAGCAAGALAGLGYTRIVIRGLRTVWSGATASAPIEYFAEPRTVLVGAGIGAAVALGAMFVTLVLQGRATARQLLAAGAEGRIAPPAGRRKLAAAGVVAGVCLLAAGALVLAAAQRAVDLAGAFFGSGGLLLIGGLALSYLLLGALGRRGHERIASLAGLGFRTCGRRRWRSLTTAGLLACGVFLVASVEVFRLHPGQGAEKPASGTGGFALYGESAVPILHDLNDPARRERLGLDPTLAEGATVVPLRLHEGDDASCLNLNRAQRPRLLGVAPKDLAGRFTFVETLGGRRPENPWTLLEPNAAAIPGPGGPSRGAEAVPTIPAVGDVSTLKWALHKEIGQTIDVTDERGRTVRLLIVGQIGGSIFQGSLLISDASFRRLFPSAAGHRVLLIDAPPPKAQALRAAMSAALEDEGLELSSAAGRLAVFSEVQNTYLSIFAALGGLGLVLGSVGLGIVVLRNVLERRGELALLRAVGFARGQLRWLVLWEHWTLMALGLACGVLSAALAVVPALRSPEAAVPWAPWLATLGGIIVSGVVWTFLAAAVALRGELLDALRPE